MIKDVTKKDVAIGFFSQLLTIGSGIIIIPIAIKYLSAQDLGLWYVFTTLISLAYLLEFGFLPTISRMTSYVYGGAKELRAQGIPEQGKKLELQILKDLLEASKQLYALVAILAFIVLFFLGTTYLDSFHEFGKNQEIAWYVFLFISVINLYFTFYNGIIIGRGEQQVVYYINAKSKVIMLAVSTVMLINDYGLLSMAIGTLCSTLYSRYELNKHLYRSDEMLEIKSTGLKKKENYIRVLFSASYKLGLTSLGGFLILRSNMLLASSFLGLKVAASYGLTVQAINILSSVSSMVFELNLPKFNSLQSSGKRTKLASLVPKTIFLSLCSYTLGAVVLFFIGSEILTFISSNTNIVESSILLLMLVMYFLELSHSLAARYLTTLNIVPFLNATIISGVAIAILGYIVVTETNYGLFGLVGIQTLVQLSFNNWYWPLVMIKHLRGKREF
ncbi:O-unit flippase-like protein [Photobacterium sp. GB-72]|uniref:O-unit flippase-like protein n=1 Tax=Photobacterium sp. GB-72 TaxID=2022105 RepID=UPI000D16D4D4|nr:O-unit flippase-like protein [Photobacterium sp. GB-72]PSV32326.1 hypothetical protein C9J40_03890 [Photobacterium sp. GB-72]